MIKPNLSITTHLTHFIHEKHESKAFMQREIVARVAGLALPIFALADVIVHSAGMLESCIKGVIIKPGDFTDFHRHSKCVKIFLRLFIFSSFYGVFIPSLLFRVFEDETVSCVNALLLSKYPKYSKNCTVNDSKIVKYIKKHVHQMEKEDLQGMEDSFKLLADAEKYLSRENLQILKKSTQTKLTHNLTDLIRKLRTFHGSFVKTALFRHCLARLLSLGLSFTCALDLIFDIFISSCFLLTSVTTKLITNKQLLWNSKTDLLVYVLTLFRDHLIHLAGILTGSIIGLIDPDTAVHLTDTHSSWYQKFQCKGERYTDSMLEDLAKMQEGESLLIPLSFRTDESGHIVYCLADKTSDGYHFTTLNTGYGSGYAETMLKLVICKQNGLDWKETRKRMTEEHFDFKEKHLANYTFKNLTYSQLSSHVRAIHEFAELNFRKIQKKAREKELTTDQYTCGVLYPISIASDEGHVFPENGRLNSQGLPDLTCNPQLMFSSSQTIGDCPKSSLLAALNYHSSRRTEEPNHQPFDRWVRKLQDRVLDQDGYLLDISLMLKNHDRQARKVAKTHLEERWSSYVGKYLTV